MLDFWASGADGVTVLRVTDLVVVFRIAGGLPSRARVATGELDRKVFIVAVLLSFPAGLPSLDERVPPGVARFDGRCGGAPAGLPL